MGQQTSRDPVESGPFAVSRHYEACPLRKVVQDRDFVVFIAELKTTLRRRESIVFAPPGAGFDLTNVEEDVLAYKVNVDNVLYHHVYLRCDCAARYGGMDINILDSRGQAALHVAVRKKDVEMSKLLLNLGADPSLHNRFGMTPLHIACETGGEEMLRLLLLTGVDANVREGNQGLGMIKDMARTPLMVAASYGQVSCLSQLTEAGATPNAGDTEGNTALHKAAVYGHRGCVAHLLQRDANPDAQNAIGATPLQLALLQQHRGIIADLLSARCDVTLSSHVLPPVIVLAAMTGEYQVLKTCAERGEDVEARDKSGMTPLYYCYSCNAERLRSTYPDINSQGVEFNPQFALIKGRHETFQFLMEHGSDVEGMLSDVIKHGAMYCMSPQNVKMLTAAICACGFARIEEAAAVTLFWGVLSRNRHLVRVYLKALPLLDKHLRPVLDDTVDWTGSHTDESILRYLETVGADEATAALVKEQVYQPRRLQEWCRQAVRRTAISKNVSYFAHRLPLPSSLQSYIVLDDVMEEQGKLVIRETKAE